VKDWSKSTIAYNLARHGAICRLRRREGKFFKALRRKNERAFFQARKGGVRGSWNAPMKRLLSEVKDAIDSTYAHVDLDEPKVFPHLPGLRFSKINLVKTHIAVHPAQAPEEVTDLPMALYFHVGATEIFAPRALHDGAGFARALSNGDRGCEARQGARQAPRFAREEGLQCGVPR